MADVLSEAVLSAATPDEVLPDEVLPDEVLPDEVLSVEALPDEVLSDEPVLCEFWVAEPVPDADEVESSSLSSVSDFSRVMSIPAVGWPTLRYCVMVV